MCLTIKEHEVKVATEDIPVFKILNTPGMGYYSPVYHKTWWKIGETKEVPAFSGRRTNFSDTIPFNCFVVLEGLHSYDPTKRTVESCHSHMIGGVVADMTIPKGTKYIVGENGELVSLALRFDGIRDCVFPTHKIDLQHLYK